jgi:hypothetical protein
VAFQHPDLHAHATVPHEVLDLAFGQELDEPAEGMTDHRHPEDDDEHRVNALGGAPDRLHFTEADARDGDHDHVKGVEPAPAEGDVAEDPQDDHDDAGGEPLDHPPQCRALPDEILAALAVRLGRGLQSARLDTPEATSADP